MREWLDRVVVGLNLCPFAALPVRLERVRIVACDAQDEVELLAALREEITRLSRTPAEETETTLLVVTRLLARFDEYNQFLDLADALVRACGFEGVFQIASFHPDYRFEGSEEDDLSNFTNRSPWPLLHILRERSVGDALARNPDAANVYEQNVRTLRSLDESEIRALFRWRYSR